MRASHPPLLEPEAFSNLYERTHLTIFRFIFGLHGGPIEEVEDLTCDTFFRAWRGRLHFSGGDHDALCWLFTIARRLVIDAHRHKRARHGDSLIRLDDDNFETALQDAAQTPEQRAMDRDEFSHLWSALRRLPEDKRELLVLRYMLGWRIKDIAGYMRKEENTVSVSIKRCLEQIRKQWSVE
jgi:RNA polymerase sigma-70 factor (ECF subfamily)